MADTTGGLEIGFALNAATEEERGLKARGSHQEAPLSPSSATPSPDANASALLFGDIAHRLHPPRGRAAPRVARSLPGDPLGRKRAAPQDRDLGTHFAACLPMRWPQRGC